MLVFYVVNVIGGRCDNLSVFIEEDSMYKENGCFIDVILRKFILE